MKDIRYSRYLSGSFLLLMVLLWPGKTKAFIETDPGKPVTTAFSRPYVDSLNKKALRLAPAQSQEAIRLSNKALRIAERISYDDGRVYALNNLAIIMCSQGNYSQSMDYSRQALRLAYQTEKAQLIGHSYYYLGDLHKVLGNFDKAMAYFKQAFYLFNRSKDYAYAVRSLSNFGHATMDKGSLANDTSYYRIAIKYYNAALQIARQHYMTNREIGAFVNLSNAYNVFGKKTGNKHYLDISLAYSLKSLDLAEEKHELQLKAISLTNLGEIMESYEDFEKAIEYYRQALDIYQAIEEYNWMVYANNKLGKVYEKTRHYDKAIDHINQSVVISKTQHFKNGLQESYNLLADIYSAKKDHAVALEYYKKSNAFKDSLTQQKNLIALAGLQLEFDSEQKDHKIALLSKDQLLKEQAIGIQNVYRNFLTGGCVALFILLVFVYLRYREKQRTALEILKAKEAAEKAKELQEQFLTNTSHEIRTPMNGIIGMTQHLLDSHLSADQRQYISVINESANNLMVIINDLLDMSKIKAGKMNFETKPFSIREMIRSIAVLLESKTKEKDIALRTNIDPQIPELITGDAVRIQQVLLNLAGNAVKFTEEGEVCLRVELLQEDEEKLHILFVVKDSGIGIPDEQLENIFENFTQVDGKTTRKQGGTGLGLAISKQLVRQMGGNISVHSIEGKGSVFKVDLFLGLHQAEQKPIDLVAETKQPAVAGNPLAGLTVLVVDDNKINRQVASLSLEKWGVHVILAEGGQEAVDQLTGNKNIDIVLMDVLMPGMDGFETTRYIRQQMNRSAGELPIVAMTASAIHGERDKCLAAGMNDYISKPFNPISLFDLLSRHVNAGMRQRERPATNFAHLQAKADGNHEFLMDIMETYITEMPEYLVELNYQIIQEDLRNIRAQAHKMKSPAALFGANELKEHLQYIELHIEQGITPEIRKKLELINDLCRRTIDETTEALKQVSKLVK